MFEEFYEMYEPEEQEAVSYTHLDVYKRQGLPWMAAWRSFPLSYLTAQRRRIAMSGPRTTRPLPVSYTHLPQDGLSALTEVSKMNSFRNIYASDLSHRDRKSVV